MLQIQNLAKQYHGEDLFSDVSFAVACGERIGLVGKNGSGKTTLIKILLGKEDHDAGTVTIPKGYTIGHLDQHIRFSENTVLEECCLALPEEEKEDHFRAKKILSGLGFSEENFSQHPSAFSGGYQLRINLTKTLLQKPHLLLLDEPTNYLDITSMRWLRRFLLAFQGEVIITTHDRAFMDSVTTHTMGFHQGRFVKVKGTTRTFYTQVTQEDELHEKTRQKQLKKREQLQTFVDRFGAKASKASQAQSKLKQIEKMNILDARGTEKTLGFSFHFAETHAKTLMRVNDISFAYPETPEDVLFEHISFDLALNDRIAIIGKNGKGKTTLLNVLHGALEPTHGSVSINQHARIGHYKQTNKKDLTPTNTVLEEIALANPRLSHGEVRKIASAMLFQKTSAEKQMSVLSGGEQGRVLLGKILARPANLLLLDEPSNHLDMESVEQITEEVCMFPGAVILVTHNESMLRKIATRLIILGQGPAKVFNGTYDEFLEKVGWEEEGPVQKKKKISKADLRKQRAKELQLRSAKNAPYKKELESVAKELQKVQQGIVDAEKTIAECDATQNLQETYATLGKLVAQKDVLEEIQKKIEAEMGV